MKFRKNYRLEKKTDKIPRKKIEKYFKKEVDELNYL